MKVSKEYIKWLARNMFIYGDMSCEYLASRAGISKMSMSRLINRQRRVTPAEVVTFAYIFGEEDRIPELMEMSGNEFDPNLIPETRRLVKFIHEERSD